MLEVKFYREFRSLKNGGLIATGLRCGVTSGGRLLMPAKKLGLSDSEALSCAGDPTKPVMWVDDILYIDIEHAILLSPCAKTRHRLRMFMIDVILKLIG